MSEESESEPQDPAAAAARAHAELGAWLSSLRRGSGRRVAFAAPKHIAAVALCLQRKPGLARDHALEVAADVVGRELGFASASVRKNISEARAILEFGALNAADVVADSPQWLFHELLAIRVETAIRQRAEGLAGVKGGRPPRASAPVLARVRTLLRRALADPQAAEELQLIRRELFT